jgi:Mg2+ and Co2+ transporter CorA
MTNTPDTDANQIFLGLNPDEGDYFVPAEIARQLEQQRDSLTEELDALKRSILDLSHPNMKLLLEERNKAVNNYETAVLREHRMEEQRDWYKAACDKYSEDETINTLRSLKEQRDRLAEALRDIADYDVHGPYGSHLTEIAREALAAVKGGSHE